VDQRLEDPEGPDTVRPEPGLHARDHASFGPDQQCGEQQVVGEHDQHLQDRDPDRRLHQATSSAGAASAGSPATRSSSTSKCPSSSASANAGTSAAVAGITTTESTTSARTSTGNVSSPEADRSVTRSPSASSCSAASV